MNKKIYRWQPELATTIIYWSCTFSILFISLILTLEHTKPYSVSTIFLLFFFFFFYLGFNCYFTITNQQLVICTFSFLKKKSIHLHSIEKIKIGNNCIEITSNDFKNKNRLFIMSNKNKDLFVKSLKQNKSFVAPIIEDKHLKIGEK